MKPQRTFVAERAAAVHCAELMNRAPPPHDYLPELTRFGDRLAKLLAPALAPYFGGQSPKVCCSSPNQIGCDELSAEIGPLAANSLLACTSADVPMLVSLDGKALLRIIDRSFGGCGRAPEALPDAFSLSAELMIARLEGLFAAQIASALDKEASVIRPVRRDASLAALAPFVPERRLDRLVFEAADLRLLVALPSDTLGALFGQKGSAPALPEAANPAAEPFCAVPLPLTAVLVDMPVSAGTIAALEPGDVLPVAVARHVPLQIAGHIIAHGTVGAQDDCAALRITQLA